MVTMFSKYCSEPYTVEQCKVYAPDGSYELYPKLTCREELCSREDIATKLGLNIEDVPAVHISNPKTLEFQVVRTLLLPGLLKTLAANKKMPLPLKLFEISDRAVRGTSGAYARCTAAAPRASSGCTGCWTACWRCWASAGASTQATHCASVKVLLRGASIGKIGVIHPRVLAAFELTNPCSAVEITIEPFV
ncbi:Phenylalanyl-tRNA synthetase beta subunit [Operophtera brumata]|uniref:Phenylalanyl-tRNA synthetase beta subunit n=1 Tax=Operophtera brumata TaxID=104452 RepID=A0A0L7KZX3_OPEBR|nr:Phenylalanyl-tRNA synthetase beta subunit [Operophtera brumata]